MMATATLKRPQKARDLQLEDRLREAIAKSANDRLVAAQARSK